LNPTSCRPRSIAPQRPAVSRRNTFFLAPRTPVARHARGTHGARTAGLKRCS